MPTPAARHKAPISSPCWMTMKLYCPECKATFDDLSMTTCPNDDARLFTLEDESMDPLIGQLIDQRFKIESKLGQGGMGAVYNAVQLSVGRRVAVKVLKKELIDREVALERFYRESKLTSELSHPNIVKLIDFGQDRERDLLYLVMELVQGLNMADLLEQGRMRINLALEIVYQVCGALTEPHAQGIIHRDLKPDNLLIVPITDGTIQVKVLDFGIARALETNTQLTATGMVCGTPAYMAPEQAQNQDLGPQTDLYALGVMLYEMLTGLPPFDGQNSLQIMLQHIQSAPKPLSAYFAPGALPDEVQALVHDLLAKTPQARPKSAIKVRAIIEDIRRLYQLEPVRIDPQQDRALLFEHLILAPLPGINPGRSQKGHTEALRRETDLQRQAGASYSTDERQQIALADTSLHPQSQPDMELVTVPAHEAALANELARDASRPHSPSTPDSPGDALPPKAERFPEELERRANIRANLTTDTRPASSTSTTGIKLVAVSIIALVVLATGALLAILLLPGDDTTQTLTDSNASPPDFTQPLAREEAPTTGDDSQQEPPAATPSTPPAQEPLDTTATTDTEPAPTQPDEPAPEQPGRAEPIEPVEKTKPTTSKPVASKPVKKTTRPTRDVKEPIAEKPKTTASTPIAKPLADTPPAKVEVKPSSTPPKQEEEEKKKGLGNLFGNSKKSNKGSNFLE